MRHTKIMKIHYFQHVPFEGLAFIESWAIARGYTLSSTRFFAGEALPQIQDIDFLIVMGGPMNIYETEKYFWLTEEKRFIEQAIQQDKIVLGICLGAQLIADVLGAKVTQNAFKEIGWFPVELTAESAAFHSLPQQFNALHWHGDTFELPRGAVHLARSEGCENQAFVYGEKVLSLQFHLEATPTSTQQIIANCGNELVQGKYIQMPEEMMGKAENFTAANLLMAQVLDNLNELISAR
jgi:GMP synthase (glutamine-hydrolysing)